MSDYRAIAGVSSTLSTLLADRMRVPVPVTVAPPDVTIAGTSGKRVNLYLYQVTEDGYLKNQDLPGRGHPGGYGRPPLSLVLHYLLTAHGDAETSQTGDLQAQQILGDAMQVLHDFSVVNRELLQERDTTRPPVLDASLLQEFERIRVTLTPLSLDDQSRMWSALPKGAFRRSVAYEVAVIQIESRLPRGTAPPVARRRLHVAIAHRPEIARAYRTPPSATDPTGDPRVAVLASLTVEGHNFLSRATRIRLGGLEPIRLVPGGDDRLVVQLPDDQYPIDPDHPATRPIPPEDRLQPGPQVVQVLTEHDADIVDGALDRGASTTGRAVQTSNHAVFMLVPQVTARSPASGGDGTVLRLQGRRLYHPDLVSQVLVGDRAFDPLDPAASGSPPGTVRSDTDVRVRVTGLTTGTYGVRARVNGAESTEPLTFQVTS